MIINNPKYNSLPEQVEQNRKDIQQIKDSHLVDVDDELSTQSTNPVQNKIITEALETEEFERKQGDETLDTTKQNKNDDTLETTDKTIVGAINELNSGKQDNLTEAQQNAVDSGIDSTKVEQITTNANDIEALKEEKASAFINEDFAGSNTQLNLTGNVDNLFKSYSFTTKGRPFVVNLGLNCVCNVYSLIFEIYIDGVKKTNAFMTQNIQGSDNNTNGFIFGSQTITGVSAGTHTISIYVNNKNNANSTMYLRNYSLLTLNIFEI